MGRQKAGQLRLLALNKLAGAGGSFARRRHSGRAVRHREKGCRGPSSSLEMHRDQLKQWVGDGINGRMVHRVLMEAHGQ